MDSTANWCWCCVVPPPGEIVTPINSDEVKKGLISKAEAMVSLKDGAGFGILISKDLVLTTNTNIPDQQAARDESIGFRVSPGTGAPLKQKLHPERFFVTNSSMDLTLVACDPMTATHFSPLMVDASKLSRQSLEVGNKVYIVGYPSGSKVDNNPALGEGRVAFRDDKYLKFQTDSGLIWAAGSAGFNERGQLAFIVCHPQRLSPSSSSENGQAGVSIKDVCSRMMHGTAPAAIRAV